MSSFRLQLAQIEFKSTEDLKALFHEVHMELEKRGEMVSLD